MNCVWGLTSTTTTSTAENLLSLGEGYCDTKEANERKDTTPHTHLKLSNTTFISRADAHLKFDLLTSRQTLKHNKVLVILSEWKTTGADRNERNVQVLDVSFRNARTNL